MLPPKAQKRARSRAFILKGAGKGGQDIAMAGKPYTDKEQRKDNETLASIIYLHRPKEGPMQGGLMLGVRAYLPIPPSKPKKWQALALAGITRPETKPDVDNLLKQIKDSAKGILWGDDKQVVGYLPGMGKYYGSPPRWEIEIITLEEYRETLEQRYEDLLRRVYQGELL